MNYKSKRLASAKIGRKLAVAISTAAMVAPSVAPLAALAEEATPAPKGTMVAVTFKEAETGAVLDTHTFTMGENAYDAYDPSGLVQEGKTITDYCSDLAGKTSDKRIVDAADGEITLDPTFSANELTVYVAYSETLTISYDLDGAGITGDDKWTAASVASDDDKYAVPGDTVTGTSASFSKDGYGFKGTWSATVGGANYLIPVGTKLADGNKIVMAGTGELAKYTDLDGEPQPVTLKWLAKQAGGNLELTAQFGQKYKLAVEGGDTPAVPNESTFVGDESEIQKTKYIIDTDASMKDKTPLLGYATSEDGAPVLTRSSTFADVDELIEDGALAIVDGTVTLYAVFSAKTSATIAIDPNLPAGVATTEVDYAASVEVKSGQKNYIDNLYLGDAATEEHSKSLVFDYWEIEVEGKTYAMKNEGYESVIPDAAVNAALAGSKLTAKAVWKDIYSVVYSNDIASGGKANVTDKYFGYVVDDEDSGIDLHFETELETLKNLGFEAADGTYMFSGWTLTKGSLDVIAKDGADFTQELADAASDGTVTLYAVWAKKGVAYDIAFQPNGGTGKKYVQTVAVGDGEKLQANTFTRAYYKFAGWNTVDDGSGTAVEDGGGHEALDATGSKNGNLSDPKKGDGVKLYAQWAPMYTIKYDASDELYDVAVKATGSTADQAAVKGEKESLSENGFKRAGFTFDGWYADKELTKKVSSTADLDKQVSDNAGGKTVTVYAKWILGETPEPEPEPVKLGWYKAGDGEWHYATVVDSAGTVADKTGWHQENASDWYFFGADGKMYRNQWHQSPYTGKWYYFGGNGVMVKNMGLKLNDHWYWFKEDGTAAQNEWVNGSWFYDWRGWWTAYEDAK